MAGRKAGTQRSDSTYNAKARGLNGDEPVLAEKPGPAPWAPTPEQAEQIKSLAGRGVGVREIAALMGIDKDTLMNRCGSILAEGRAIGVATISGVLFGEARKGSYKHAALYLQHVGGWSTRQVTEHSGEGGGPVVLQVITGVPDDDSDD